LNNELTRQIVPSPAVAATAPYSVPKHGAPIDLKLDANEGEAPSPDVLREIVEIGPDVMRRYPDASALTRLLAERFQVEPSQLLVTAGADDSLDRLCRALIGPGRRLLLTNPSFEMLPRYARLMRGEVDEVPWWDGPFPTDEFLAAAKPETILAAVVSPNNPTGTVATREDLDRISAALPQAVLLLDHAYVEFADEDLTEYALTLPNCVIVRTFSKALGLAGLRVGYAISSKEIIGWMRVAGSPYSVSRPSIALCAARIQADHGSSDRFIAQVRRDRKRLHDLLDELGIEHTRSEGNFVFPTTELAIWIRDAFAGLGIAIRAYPGHPELGRSLRITCPGDEAQCDRMLHALRGAVAPEVLMLPENQQTEQLARTARERGLETIAELPAGERLPGWQICLDGEQVSAARQAGLVPIGWLPEPANPPRERTDLIAAGAARAVADLDEVKGWLP